MKLLKIIAYLTAVFVGVLIANPAIISIVFDGPESFVDVYKGVTLINIYGGEVKPRETSHASQVIWAAIYVVFGIYALYSGTVRHAIKYTPIVLVLFVLQVFFSMTWSYKPDESIIRGLHLLGKTLVAYQLTRIFTPHGAFCYLRDCLLLVVVSSLIVIVYYPEIGVTEYGGDKVWSGLFTNKNGLGHCAALCGILCFHFYRVHGYKALHHAAAFLLSAVITIKSQSATSLIVLVGGLGLYSLAGIFGLNSIDGKLRYRLLTGIFAAVLAALALSASYWETLLSTVDRDITLTGRTVIWSGVWEMIQNKPLFGYGYRAAWSSGDIFYHVLSKLQSWTASAHNSFLQSWLELGLLGFLLFSGFIAYTVLIWIKRYSEDGSTENLLAGVVLLMLLLIAMVESALFTTQEVHWYMWSMISMLLWNNSDNFRVRFFKFIENRFSKKLRLSDSLLRTIDKTQRRKRHRRISRRRRSHKYSERNDQHQDNTI